jgi:hypothetical protein
MGCFWYAETRASSEGKDFVVMRYVLVLLSLLILKLTMDPLYDTHKVSFPSEVELGLIKKQPFFPI